MQVNFCSTEKLQRRDKDSKIQTKKSSEHLARQDITLGGLMNTVSTVQTGSRNTIKNQLKRFHYFKNSRHFKLSSNQLNTMDMHLIIVSYYLPHYQISKVDSSENIISSRNRKDSRSHSYPHPFTVQSRQKVFLGDKTNVWKSVVVV
jgi:hypothetical protein